MFSAVIAAFLYLRITVAMWMGDDDEAVVPAKDLPVPEGVRIALLLSIVFTLGVGLFPHTLAGLASDATAVLVQFTG